MIASSIIHDTWRNFHCNCFLWPPYALTLKHSYNLQRLVFLMLCVIWQKHRAKRSVTRVVSVKVLILNGYSRPIADAVGVPKICYETFLELCLCKRAVGLIDRIVFICWIQKKVAIEITEIQESPEIFEEISPVCVSQLLFGLDKVEWHFDLWIRITCKAR